MIFEHQKQKRKIFLMLSLVILVFFSTITLFGEEGLLKLRRLYQFRDQVQLENQELANANQKLLENTALLKQPIQAERLIREKLGYLKQNELVLFLEETPKKFSKHPAQE